MPDADPTSGVGQSLQLLVSILEPHLAARGSLIGAKVVCDPPEAMFSDEARRLADALVRAGDVADEADRKLLPILESYAEVRDGLLYGRSE